MYSLIGNVSIASIAYSPFIQNFDRKYSVDFVAYIMQKN